MRKPQRAQRGGELAFVEQAGAGAEFGVEAAAGQKFVMLAAFDDFSVVEDKNLVGVADGGEAVGYDKAGLRWKRIICRASS